MLIAAVSWLGGCQTTLYDWGSYNASVLELYAPSGMEAQTVGVQIEVLQREITATQSQAKANEASRVPPGKCAQLAYLYAIQGDRVQARQYFEEEKRLYPESARFIDGMLTRLQ